MKKAILDDVYRDNNGDGKNSAVIRKRREQYARSRHRARLLGRSAAVLLLLPICALAVHWILPMYSQTRKPLSIQQLNSVASRDNGHTVLAIPLRPGKVAHSRQQTQLATNTYQWAAQGATLQSNLLVQANLQSDRKESAAQPATPSPPSKAWFKNYTRLIGTPGFSMAQLFGLNVKTIVIDAGHGGRDPGAIGPDGLKEKTVTLAVAKDLQKRLSRLKGYRVLLSRKGDYYVPLKGRVQFANKHNADLFISIHVNSIPEANRAVVETYYFGATKNHATMKLARKENQGSDYTMGDFHRMINKLGYTFKTRQSRLLAQLIQQHLYRNIKSISPHLADDGIHTAPFVVLLGTNMPSVLAEISCISNPIEEHRLATASYQKAIAKYMEKGIVAYLHKHQHDLKITKGVQQYAGKERIHAG